MSGVAVPAHLQIESPVKLEGVSVNRPQRRRVKLDRMRRTAASAWNGGGSRKEDWHWITESTAKVRRSETSGDHLATNRPQEFFWASVRFPRTQPACLRCARAGPPHFGRLQPDSGHRGLSLRARKDLWAFGPISLLSNHHGGDIESSLSARTRGWGLWFEPDYSHQPTSVLHLRRASPLAGRTHAQLQRRINARTSLRPMP